MERIQGQHNKYNLSIETDPAMRIGTRAGSNNGNVFRDNLAGSSLLSKTRRDGYHPSRSMAASSDHDDVFSDDQLDSFSEASPVKKNKPQMGKDARGKEVEVLDIVTKNKNLQRLKFSKNKPSQETIEIASDAEPSLKPTKSAVAPKPSGSRVDLDFSDPPTPPPRQKPKPKGRTKAKVDLETEPFETSHPRFKPPTTVGEQRDPSLEIVPGPSRVPASFPMGSPPRRQTVKTSPGPSRKPQPAPFVDDWSNFRTSPSSSAGAGSRKPQPAPFLEHSRPPTKSSRRRDSPCNTFPPDTKAKKTKKLKASPSKERRSSSGKNTRGGRVVLSGSEDDKAAPFPMAAARRRSSSGKNTRRIVSESEEDFGSKAAPFPMAEAAPKKRVSSGTDEVTPRKRSRFSDDDDDGYVEEHSMLLTAPSDPRTLCPYCDGPLPPEPSPTLVQLLESTAKKSYPDPRPANPLGRRAPFTTFIALCQRHCFETDILPEAQAKGWPQTINWKRLEGRIEKLRDQLQELIDDVGCREDGPRRRCEAWTEIMEVVKAKGSKAATGVKDQFNNFEKTQPGYYGELGSFIIHQTLYNLFPPTSIDASLIRPLNAEEFIQRILIPEVALLLIIQDQHFPPDAAKSRRKAFRILRESSAYGVAMFPADSNEKISGKGMKNGQRGAPSKSDGLDAGETIIKERARKRRQEIEEEERREEEERQRQDGRKKGPRPRPIPKGSSSTSSLMDVDAIQDEDIPFMDGRKGRHSAPRDDTGSVDGDILNDNGVETEARSDTGTGRRRGQSASKKKSPSFAGLKLDESPSRSGKGGRTRRKASGSSIGDEHETSSCGYSEDEIDIQDRSKQKKKLRTAQQKTTGGREETRTALTRAISISDDNEHDEEWEMTLKTPRPKSKKTFSAKYSSDDVGACNATPKPKVQHSKTSDACSSTTSSRVATVGRDDDDEANLAPLERAKRRRALKLASAAAAKPPTEDEDEVPEWKTNLRGKSINGKDKVKAKNKEKQLPLLEDEDNPRRWLLSGTESSCESQEY